VTKNDMIYDMFKVCTNSGNVKI